MKIKVKIILGIIIAIMMMGCSSDSSDNISVDKTLAGESENWEATYIVKGVVEFNTNEKGTLDVNSDGKYELVIKYKGALEELEDMRTIKVDQSVSGTEKGFDNPPENVEFKYQGSPHTLTLIDINNEGSIQITVSWDGKNESEEDIILK